MNELVVLVPVLGRPANAGPLVESWREAKTVPSTLLFIATRDDTEQLDACSALVRSSPYDVRLDILDVPARPGDFARKINRAFRTTDEPFLFQAADDVVFCPGWDAAALAVAVSSGAGVVGTNDHGNPTVMRGRHSTHSLIRRTYVDDPGASLDGPGVVFSEAYGHQYVDTELVELAKSRGQWAFAADSAVCHEHPFWHKEVPRDATYERGLASAAADQRLYMQRRRQWATR